MTTCSIPRLVTNNTPSTRKWCIFEATTCFDRRTRQANYLTSWCSLVGEESDVKLTCSWMSETIRRTGARAVLYIWKWHKAWCKSFSDRNKTSKNYEFQIWVRMYTLHEYKCTCSMFLKTSTPASPQRANVPRFYDTMRQIVYNARSISIWTTEGVQ